MNCLICDTPTETFVDEKSNIHYNHCTYCECISKSPDYFQSIESQKERYDLHENDPEDKGYQSYFKRFLDFVLPLTQCPKTALDFGCGRSSLLASLLANEGIDCDFYDPIYHPKNMSDSKKYQLIVSTEVFEHLHDPKSIFQTLLERVVEGGYLALQTQFHPNDIELFKKWYYHKDPTHIVFFTPKTFKVLCQISGCEFVEDNGKNMLLIKKR